MKIKSRYNKGDVIIPLKGEWAPNVSLIKIEEVNEEYGEYSILVMVRHTYDFNKRFFNVSIEDTDRTTIPNTKAGKVLYGKKT